MIRRTVSTWLRFVMASTLASASLWGKVPLERAQVTISVYNEAGVPGDVLTQGEKEALRVFWKAGIEVKWLNCNVPAATEEESGMCRKAVSLGHFHLRVVREAAGLKRETMGIAFVAEDGSGCYADLFYEPMKELHNSDGTNLASLLGHVAAHEVGHLLLGANSHGVAGIMHARWTSEELENTRRGRLVFADKESRKMKERLLTSRRLSNQDSPATASDCRTSRRFSGRNAR